MNQYCAVLCQNAVLIILHSYDFYKRFYSVTRAVQGAVKCKSAVKSAVLTTQKKNCIIILGLFLRILAGANGPVRLPSALSGGGGKASFFMHFSVPAGTRRSRPGPCGRRLRLGCGNKCRIHDAPDPYDIVEAVNDLTEAVEAVQKSIIWTRKARTCTGCGKRCGTAKRKHSKTYVLKCFSLSLHDKKDTLSQNSSDFLFALLGQSWRPLQHPFQIVGARYFPYGKRTLFVSPIKQ